VAAVEVMAPLDYIEMEKLICLFRKHRPRKFILLAENIMPGAEKLRAEHVFLSEKLFYSLFFFWKGKSSSEFFRSWHNPSSQQEHILTFHRYCITVKMNEHVSTFRFTLMLVYHYHNPVFTPKIAIFRRAGMREGGLPLPLAFQYLILMI
jgi:hypothetical protein